MGRYQLTRGFIIHKGKRYGQGDFLPEDFTEKDRWRTIAPHSIVLVPEEQLPESLNTKAAPLTGEKPVEVAAKATIKTAEVAKGIQSAKVNPAPPKSITGTKPK